VNVELNDPIGDARIVHAVAKAFQMPAAAIRHGHGGLARTGPRRGSAGGKGWRDFISIAASLRLASCGR